MKAFVILFSSTGEVDRDTDAEIRAILEHNLPNTIVQQSIQLSDVDVVNASMQCATRVIPDLNIQVVKPLIPTEAEVKAAGEYLIANYGEPDDEDSFRIRVQMGIRSGDPTSDRYRRTMSAIEILSKLHGKKLSIVTNRYLQDTGLVFMKSFANSLLRMKDLQTMGKTFKDRKETREYNKGQREKHGPKLQPYNRSEERKQK